MPNILCLTWPVTSQVTPRSNFSTLSERSRPGLSIAVWIIPPRQLVTEIDGGPLRPLPPSAECRGRTRPCRARVKSLSWPTIETLVMRRDLVKVYKCLMYDDTPEEIRGMFARRSDVSARQTRASQRGDLHVTKCKLSATLTQRVFSQRGVQLCRGVHSRHRSAVSPCSTPSKPRYMICHYLSQVLEYVFYRASVCFNLSFAVFYYMCYNVRICMTAQPIYVLDVEQYYPYQWNVLLNWTWT